MLVFAMVIVFLTFLGLGIKLSRWGKNSLGGVKIHQVGTSESKICQVQLLTSTIQSKEDKNSIPQCIGQSHITTAFSNMAPFPSRTRVRQTCADVKIYQTL